MLLTTLMAASLAAISATPIFAEDQAKPPTPQQQKMKDCAAKWTDEKAQKHVSGREAHRTFMSQCLKG